MITGIHHIALKCKDPENYRETVHFYCDVIGMKMLRYWGEGEHQACMLELGGDVLEIFASGLANEETGTINHFAFYTDDPDECIARIQKAGYQVKMMPADIDIHLTEPQGEKFPLRVAFCYGPIGEEIEFFSER